MEVPVPNPRILPQVRKINPSTLSHGLLDRVKYFLNVDLDSCDVYDVQFIYLID